MAVPKGFLYSYADPARGVRPPWARPSPVVAASVPLARVVAGDQDAGPVAAGELLRGAVRGDTSA